MWKSLVVAILAVPLALTTLIIFWVGGTWRTGIVAGASTFAICLIVSTLMIFTIKKFSLVDVFLPLIFSVVWSAILTVLSVGGDLFTAPAAIGSGFILTLCLWKAYHNESMGKNWLIFPVIVYMYEMLPVNIPGPFDDYFCFGGDVVCAILLFASASFAKQLPESSNQEPGGQRLIPGSYKSNR
jgi:hypothetical protein